MINLFSEDSRRNPYPAYERMRNTSPLFHMPQAKLWIVFDYDGVKRVLEEHEVFSSRHGPVEWMIFLDPPQHTRLRALISQAFTPRTVANLEPRIRELCRELLAKVEGNGAMDVVLDFAAPLPTMVIAEMLGAPAADWPLFHCWNDAVLKLSQTVPGGSEATGATNAFVVASGEMNAYLTEILEQRRVTPRDDLFSRLLYAELDGERLTQAQILGFFQLLLLAGSETTTNLISNALLCFIENPDQLARLRAAPELLPSAIEEVLRYRSSVQWMIRVTTRDVELHGQTIPAGQRVLAVMGSANRDPKRFRDPDRFDICREPNPHLAFGHGIHFCLGAALSRLEGRVAFSEFLARVNRFELAESDPWLPREGLHVLGPASLTIRLAFTSPAAAH